ncbi:HAD-IC family P-type ATPase [Bifidobacterium sp. ESL0800]|uniref:HAD-IC family P-type ATPase n=1 Tax=Bifidobacterium sp. ESL0800 TaxID=2983236 RepID=UPI0023F7DB92|nr:HAD-IC family P-type ATPase [Bifidobacterium sp. ESL0800]WEV75456.1 HAD-IC family P-type ATPase [Bifidobacterium sp. ESL0800]
MRVIRKVADICRQVPMLPTTIVAAVFVALFWNYRPWMGGFGALKIGNFVAAPPSVGAWHIGPFAFNPSVGQFIVVLLVAYSVFDSVRGMVASLKAGHVGIDVLAILALLSTLGVQEYWAAWAVVLMIWSGEAIESFAQAKAESNLSALVAAAPQMAHVSDLPGVGATGNSAADHSADKTRSQDVGVPRSDSDTDSLCNTENIGNAGNARNTGDIRDAGDTDRAANRHSQASEIGRGVVTSADSLDSNENAGNARLDALFANSDKRLADGFRATLAAALPRGNARERENNLCVIDTDDCNCELSSVAKDNAASSRNRSRGSRGSQGRRAQQAGSLARHTFIGGSLARTSQASKTLESQASQDAHFHTVPVDQVKLGDVLVVLPGETIPVDGKLLSGTATLDLSAINGEPLPRTVFAGARVMSGAINGSTMIVIRATQLAKDSQYQQTMQLVDSARSSRAPVVKTADVLAVPFTIISLVIGIAAWIASGTPERFAQVLVLATPCPLLIAAPVAYMAGTGRLAKAGILTKTQEVLENLGKVSHIFFDKTGTLTVTRPQVVRVDVPDEARRRLPDLLGLDGAEAGVGLKPESEAESKSEVEPKSARKSKSDSGRSHPDSRSQRDLYNKDTYIKDIIVELAAVVETYSVHILAQGIVAAGAAASKKLHNGRTAFPVVKGVHEDAGNGVEGKVEGHTVRVGRLGFVTGASRNSEGSFAKSTLLNRADDTASTAGRVNVAAKTSGTDNPEQVDHAGIGSQGSRDNRKDTENALADNGSSFISRTAGARDFVSGDQAGNDPCGHRGGNEAISADSRDKKDSTSDVSGSPCKEPYRGQEFPASQFKARAADEMAAYVSIDGILAACIVLRDVPRSNARESLQRLRSLGVDAVTMLTGDSRASADVIAAEVGIDDVRADLLPQDKVSAVKAVSHEALRRPAKVETFLDRLSGQPKPRPISVMVGDGVNDAPVLAAADIGIAMTDGTSTAASQTAQVVIMNDDIADVPRAVAIARQTKRTMLQAVVTGLGLALVCMVAAAFDLIPVVVGAFTQEAIDVVSILWALTALRERDV